LACGLGQAAAEPARAAGGEGIAERGGLALPACVRSVEAQRALDSSRSGSSAGVE